MTMTMTILDDLKADHRELKAQIGAILQTEGSKERGSQFKQFRALLTAHSRAEEKILYRRLEKSEEGKAEALEGTVEHEVADRLVEDLSKSRNLESDKWTARCTVLRELLEHHIDEEENEMFKTARNQFDQKTLAKIGEEFKMAKLAISAETVV
jgi:hemerythrin-like domain-containing protein